MSYTVEIVTTGNASPPDKQPHRGMSCASSAVWCRVTRDNESTGWVECRGVPSIIKAQAVFKRAENMRGAGFNFIPMAWSLVTLTEWPAHMPLT